MKYKDRLVILLAPMLEKEDDWDEVDNKIDYCQEILERVDRKVGDIDEIEDDMYAGLDIEDDLTDTGLTKEEEEYMNREMDKENDYLNFEEIKNIEESDEPILKGTIW